MLYEVITHNDVAAPLVQLDDLEVVGPAEELVDVRHPAERVRNFLEQRGKGVGLRLAVKTTGCSGMAYVMEYADT